MKVPCFIVLLACAGVLHGVEPGTEGVLADPDSYFAPTGGLLAQAMNDLAGQEVLIDRLQKWERELKREPESVPSLLRVLAARLCLNGRGGIQDVKGDLPMPLWMRLRRQGEEFEIFASPDGAKWTSIARQRLVTEQKVFVGVYAYVWRNPATHIKVDHIAVKGETPGSWMVYGSDKKTPSAIAIHDGMLEYGEVGREFWSWGWFAATELAGDGELTACIVDYQQPDRLGVIGLAVNGTPETDAASLRATVTMSGSLTWSFHPIATPILDLWQRLIVLAPGDMRYRVGYAKAVARTKGYKEGAQLFFKALDLDPVGTFEWADKSPEASNDAVLFINGARQLDKLRPYVDRLEAKDFKDPRVLSNLLQVMSLAYKYRNHPDLAASYMERAMALDEEISRNPDAAYVRFQGAVDTGDPGRVLAAAASALALPDEDTTRSAEQRADWRLGLNDGSVNSYNNGQYPDAHGEWVPAGRRFLSLARQSGRLGELAARLWKEPAKYGGENRWDFVRLAFCAAAQMPAILPEIESLESELPVLVSGSNAIFVSEPAPNWALPWRPPGSGTDKWIAALLEADAARPEADSNATAAMFLCVPELYDWPSTRQVALKWLAAYIDDTGQDLDDQVAAASLLFDYAQWGNDPALAGDALRHAAALLREELRENGELGVYGQGLFLKLDCGLAQYGMAAEVRELFRLLKGQLSTVGPRSAPFLDAEAALRDSAEPGMVAVWSRGAPGPLTLHYAVGAPAAKDYEGAGVPLALARAAGDDSSQERSIELQGAPDAATWRTFATIRTRSLSGDWDGRVPAGVKYVRAFADASAAAEAPVVRLPDGDNLLPPLRAEDRKPADLGERTLAGWSLPPLSTVHVRDSELRAGQPMATWVSQDLQKFQDLASAPVPIDPARPCRLSGWLRTNHTGSNVARFGLQFLDDKAKVLGTVGPRLTRLPVWQYASLAFGPGTDHPFPPGTRRARAVISAVYRVEFSELSLRPE